MNKYFKSIGLYALVFLIILAGLAYTGQGLLPPQGEQPAYTYGDLLEEMEKGNVKSLEITRSREVGDFGNVQAVLKDGSVINVNVASISTFQERADQKVVESGGSLSMTVKEPQKENMLALRPYRPCKRSVGRRFGYAEAPYPQYQKDAVRRSFRGFLFSILYLCER